MSAPDTMSGYDSWLCNACGGIVYRGVQHICTPNKRPWCEPPPPPPRGRTQDAPPDYTALLTRIADALDRISDRMPLGPDRRGA
jgi:hypothetical protein